MKTQYTIGMLLIAFCMSGLPSCKKVMYETCSQESTTYYKDGSSITKIVMKTAPEDIATTEKCENEKEAKMPKLSKMMAKHLLTHQLKEMDGRILTQDIKLGYYECNDYQERLRLYKLQTNKLITMTCDEIVTPQGSTYWVNVELTFRGKMLVETPRKPKYPEDAIDMAAAQMFLNPTLDQDAWGVPTISYDVDSTIVSAMQSFYMGLLNGKTVSESMLSSNMRCALLLLDSLKSFDVDVLKGKCLFCDSASLTEEAVAALSIVRVPRLENAYLVNLGECTILYGITCDEEGVVIEDVLVAEPQLDKVINPTICSIMGKYTEQDMISIRARKREADRRAAQWAKAMQKSKSAAKKEKKNVEHFEMCSIVNPGFTRVEHTDSTLYALAKARENSDIVQLRAAKVVVTNIKNLKVSKDDDDIIATGEATLGLRRVSAVGRIYKDLYPDFTTKKEFEFVRNEEEAWELW